MEKSITNITQFLADAEKGFQRFVFLNENYNTLQLSFFCEYFTRKSKYFIGEKEYASEIASELSTYLLGTTSAFNDLIRQQMKSKIEQIDIQVQLRKKEATNVI